MSGKRRYLLDKVKNLPVNDRHLFRTMIQKVTSDVITISAVHVHMRTSVTSWYIIFSLISLFLSGLPIVLARSHVVRIKF